MRAVYWAMFWIATLHSPAPAEELPPEYSVGWAWGAPGQSKYRMLAHQDFDGDGNSEIVLTASAPEFGGREAVFVVEADLEQHHCWRQLPESFLDGIVWNVDGDPEHEIVLVGRQQVEALDWRSCETEAVIRFSAPVDAAALGDVDDDGTLSLAFTRAGDLHVGAWNQPESTVVRRGFGGDRLQMSPVDEFPGDDILVFDTVLRLHRGSDLGTIIEWSSRPAMATTAQLIPGGKHELITGETWHDGITAHDLEDGSILFNRPVSNLSDIHAHDIDGDDVDEIVFGEQWGSVFVLEATGEVRLEIDQPGHKVGNVLAADLFSDGSPEIVWGAVAVAWHEGPRLYIADPDLEQIIDRSPALNGPFFIGGIADVNRDGRKEFVGVVNSTSDHRRDPARLLLDSRTGEVESLTNFDLNLLGTWSLDVAFGDLDDDGADELCLVVDEVPDATIHCVRPTDLSPVLSFTVPNNIGTIALLDLDSDRRPEIVTTHPDRMRAFDSLTGDLLWVSEPVSFGHQAVSLDLRRGAVISIANLRDVVRFDPANGDLLSTDSDNRIRAFAAFRDRLVVWQRGVGLALYDETSGTLGRSVFSITVDLNDLGASADGKSLIFTEGEQYVGSTNDTVVIGPATRNEPLRLGTAFAYGTRILNGGAVVGSDGFGFKSIQPEIVFYDDFDDRPLTE